MRADFVALAGLILALLAAFVSAYFFGGRRWRDNTDAEREAHRLTKERLAAREATIIEKDKTLVGQGERLEEKDRVIAMSAGTAVYEALVTQQAEIAVSFKQLADALAAHEDRSRRRDETALSSINDQHRQILGLIESVGVELSHLAHNGKD